MEQLIRWAARYGIQRMMWRGPWWLVALAIIAYLLYPQLAHSALISTTSSATVAGVAWGSGDVADLDAGAVVFDDRALFDGSENIDAWGRLGDHWLLSSSTDSTIGGAQYLDGDVIEWNPVTGQAGLFLSESIFGSADEDIDALHVFDDGRVAISTTSSATLYGTRFASGDVVLLDLAERTAAILFDGSDWFEASENIDAVSFLADDLLLFSSSTDGIALGTPFLDGDVLLADLSAVTVSIWMPETIFNGANEDIDALYQLANTAAPLPPSWLLMGLALALLLRQFKRAKP